MKERVDRHKDGSIRARGHTKDDILTGYWEAGTSGAHAWYIEPTPGGCHVVTEEAQRGLLLLFIGARTRATLLNSHQEWLRALKALAEAR
jgi:hypothetical protein